MTFVVAPSRKPEFWAAVERHKKAEGKKADVHTKAEKSSHVAPDVHRKHASKTAKPPRAKSGKPKKAKP